jgi:uncharacterized membrane protein YfcA
MPLTTEIVASLIVFLFTTVLTIAGVGAAFIIIPAFFWLGVPLKEAMATALLLNGISMAIASITFIKNRLVAFRTAVPIIIVASALSPLGAYSTKFVSRDTLLWLFVGFLVFAGSMMLFFKAKKREVRRSHAQELSTGATVGGFAGYLGGLLGVGGGNFIVPALVWLGFDPKKASGTTSFIVIFSSLAGFLGHTAMGHINVPLLALSALGSIVGAYLGAWLMARKLQSAQVKTIIGVVLYLIAAKMLWGLMG